MLPGIRLIAAAFLCGFVLTLAGLRTLDSARVARDPLFILSALAATAAQPKAPNLPAIFDARFAASPGAVMPVPVSYTRHIDGATEPTEGAGLLDTMPMPEAFEETASLSPAPVAPAPPATTPEAEAPSAIPQIEPLPAPIAETSEPAAAPTQDIATAAEFDSGRDRKQPHAKVAAQPKPKRVARTARWNDAFRSGGSRDRFLTGYPQR